MGRKDNKTQRKATRKKEGKKEGKGKKKRKTYINPKLKLQAMEIFSANFMFSFQTKIHGSRAK